MSNMEGKAYALTLVSPIKNGHENHQSYTSLTRQSLQSLDENELSPLAKVPNTFLARFYILNDVFYEGSPALEDHLKSKYLVFSSNFHGSLEEYLTGFWEHAKLDANAIWQHCVGYEKVNDAASFITYIKKCQLDTTYYFNGSTDAPLAEQLKALYLKQALSEFAVNNQGVSNEKLLSAFNNFTDRTQPAKLDGPTWAPGKSTL